ncbi:palindromic element RPE3 domain-containing protein [Rickettsia hoogstraalii]|uniref:palindromic element RPE3 domain-containing protein n=1 Tax=Rickettsia hoogstraalii TaxID=467174 RepID=UPI000590CA81|nr:palindromic element RPE3 domain-containing protein [Rickettsia hoogstraalii]
MSNDLQLNSESFRQEEFKVEPAQRIIIREHRRTPQNSLGSSFLNDAVLTAYLFTFTALTILLIASFLNYKSLKNKQNFNAKESKK